MRQFPPDFLWGVATSSYQIEGATDVDGRGESIWDRFAATPGKIADGTDGSVACDHYNRWRDDVELMRWLGVKSYRFSVAWPRVFPTGRGKVNRAGLDFYSRLVDGLLTAGIEPMVTLYHWDLPQLLQDKGGWPARDTVSAFVEYADEVSQVLGDRVTRWITHNEPWCISVLGYANGEHAPGIKDWSQALAAAHHLLLSHGQSVSVIRSNVKNAEVGITLNLVPAQPASPSAADQDACRAFDGTFNRWYLDPLYGRGYPKDVIADHVAAGRLKSEALDFVRPGDLEAMAVPTDFLGVNYYSRAILRSDRIPESQNAPRTVHAEPERTDMDWEVYSGGLTNLLVRLHKDYAPKRLYITENGAAYATGPDADGRVRDTKRAHYLRTHLEASHDAIQQGVPLGGYFAWSLMDNFEWAYGYQKRFGLVFVDYATQKRIPKDSAHLYRAVVTQNSLDAERAA
ncbi:GH1 family beta-glucosidase [Pyxidicoccus xibeiensis]|uniref:GH1 family beta-glucosidase n=1 Tax=Pyxidicoccus xibeiensis TaxID=2906759 RepID=UPI0020A72E63|nr:GH1 family beta-glucosidase [Pyxidicoccus xibeiensis]MCP3139313.1 GH1 family beta-glucosidase [Pyxidicoccus xibeiensis]